MSAYRGVQNASGAVPDNPIKPAPMLLYRGKNVYKMTKAELIKALIESFAMAEEEREQHSHQLKVMTGVKD